MTPAELAAFTRDGFAVVRGVLSPVQVAALIAAVSHRQDALEHGGTVFAMRRLLERVPEVAALAEASEVRALVEPILGRECLAVRGLLFDKTPGANWPVAWHQDLTIAVRERVDLPGYGPWSVKAGVPHVQPPVEVLEGMLAVRLHLDDCGEAAGPLRVLPGSHAHGRLDRAAVEEWKGRVSPVACLVPAGGAVLMRPLLLHASSPAAAPAHRRVIHLQYAASPLPGGLEWHEAARSRTLPR